VAGGPAQSVLRPSEIENKQLADWLLQRALFGPVPIFDQRAVAFQPLALAAED
jgi:hypothetical protein